MGPSEEEDVRKFVEQFENDTGLHFLSQDGQLELDHFETFSEDFDHLQETKLEIPVATGHDDWTSREKTNVDSGSPSASSTSSSGKSKHSMFRGWELARAAVKAVDIFPKNSSEVRAQKSNPV